MELPLEGVRVVELGTMVAGPAAAAVLADWGADVVKVEPPGGEMFRHFMSVSIGVPAGCPPFDLDNRGKRSVVLDLKTADGLAALDAVLARADVFVSNYRAGALDRLGLSPSALTERFPRLIVCHLSGFGPDGPDADRPAYDVAAFWARTGMASLMTPARGDAVATMRGGMGDHVTGLTAAGGICAALVRRATTGPGGVVRTSLFRTGAYVVGWDLAMQLQFGRPPTAEDRLDALNPALNTYRTADDRWLWLLGLESDRHWPGICAALGVPELAGEFPKARDRRHARADVIERLDGVFATKTLDEWADALDAGGVWWSPAATVDDLVADPQAAASGVFHDLPGGPEPMRTVATPVDFGATLTAPAGPVPEIGQHTAEVLLEAGLDPALVRQICDSQR